MSTIKDVYGIGHALVDLQFAVDDGFLREHGIDKGVMTLVDDQRQAELQAVLLQPPLKSASGGSAANTMIALARFGGSGHYGCRVGGDELGDFYRRDLMEAGVGISATTRQAGKTGQCMIFITPDAERTMNTSLGASAEMGPDQVDRDRLRVSRHLYLEGYLLTSEPGTEACILAQRWAREVGASVSLTLSDPAVVGAFSERFRALVDAGVDLLFCNEDEARSFTGAADTAAAVRELKNLVPAVVVTLGAEGAVVSAKSVDQHVSAVRVIAVDTTGAGDSFAGGVLFGISRDRDLSVSAQLGCFAAAEVVGKVGPRLDRDLSGQIDDILVGYGRSFAGIGPASTLALHQLGAER